MALLQRDWSRATLLQSSFDIDLELAPAWRPGFVRRPGLVVVSRGVVAGTFTATEPFAVRLDLDALV